MKDQEVRTLAEDMPAPAGADVGLVGGDHHRRRGLVFLFPAESARFDPGIRPRLSRPHHPARLCAGTPSLRAGRAAGRAPGRLRADGSADNGAALRLAEGVQQTTELTAVPFFPQTHTSVVRPRWPPSFHFSGVAVTPEPLVSQVYLPGAKAACKSRCWQQPRRYGRVSYQLAPRYSDVLREVAAGNPVIVLQDVGPMLTRSPSGITRCSMASTIPRAPSPSLRHQARQEMPFTAFEREWMKSGYWAMVVTPPDRIPVTATEEGWMQPCWRWHDRQTALPPPLPTPPLSSAGPTIWPAAIGLANQHHARGAFADAVATLRVAQQKHPDSVIVINNLAQALSDQGRHAEALVQIEAVSDPPSRSRARCTPRAR